MENHVVVANKFVTELISQVIYKFDEINKGT